MKPFGDTGILVTVKVTQYLHVFGLQGNILVAGVDCRVAPTDPWLSPLARVVPPLRKFT